MKLSRSLFASALCSLAVAARTRPTLSPETARLVIAQRLGLSRFHSLENADAEAIEHINEFAGDKRLLFGQEDNAQSRAHLLVWIDGVDEQDAYVTVSGPEGRIQGFQLSSSPPSSDNDRLIKDIITQAESLPKPADPKQNLYTTSIGINKAISPLPGLDLHNEYLSIWRVDSKKVQVLENLETILRNVPTAFTVIMMPTSRASAKRSSNAWGSYLVPAASKAGRQNPEALLSSGPEPASSPAPPVSDLEDFPIIVNAAKGNSSKGPVRGILPSCFESKSACEKTTNSCSGHGKCKLARKGRGSGGNQISQDCYSCACEPTIKHVGEDKGMESKRQVTYWGGPACQKQDISVQFWLFVGSGVLLAFLVASGIGMLYSMGSEELPSVIGAGVSGPVRK